MSNEKRRRRRQWSHITIFCFMQFNYDSPIGNFIFFFFFVRCYCICFLIHARLLYFHPFRAWEYFGPIQSEHNAKYSFFIWFDLILTSGKRLHVQNPHYLQKKWFKSPIITSKMPQTSLTFDLVFFNSPFDLVTYEKKQV